MLGVAVCQLTRYVASAYSEATKPVEDMMQLSNRGVFYIERDFDPFKDGEPGEKVGLFGVEYTLVGPRVKHGNYFLNRRKGEAIVIRLPRTFLPEDYGGRSELLSFAEIALAEDKDQAFASMLTEHEHEGLRQFVEMLYDASGSVKPSGYLALLRLRERLDETVNDFFDQLEQYANELVERRKRGQTGEIFAEGVKRKVASLIAIGDRLSLLDVVIQAFETKGTPPTLWDVAKRKNERAGWGGADPLAQYLARIGLELYNANPDRYSNRSDLLQELLKEEGTAADVRTQQDQLGILYPKGEGPGRPTKEEEKALLDEMIRRFRAVSQNGKTGKTGENGAAK